MTYLEHFKRDLLIEVMSGRKEVISIDDFLEFIVAVEDDFEDMQSEIRRLEYKIEERS